MKIERFEDLEVWQLARGLVKSIYKITLTGRFAKDFGLANQIQRSAVSVMSNIAEGFERGGKKEFIRYLIIAKGSSGELRSQLYVALDLDYVNKEKFQESYQMAERISKSLAGFIKYLRRFGD